MFLYVKILIIILNLDFTDYKIKQDIPGKFAYFRTIKIPARIQTMPIIKYGVTGSFSNIHPQTRASGGVTNVIMDMITAELFFNIQKYKTNAITVPNTAR